MYMESRIKNIGVTLTREAHQLLKTFLADQNSLGLNLRMGMWSNCEEQCQW
jgi:hypothetical protein